MNPMGPSLAGEGRGKAGEGPVGVGLLLQGVFEDTASLKKAYFKKGWLDREVVTLIFLFGPA